MSAAVCQVGTVVDDPLDYYGGRLSKGQRKASLTEQLLADSELSHSRKKRYNKLQVCALIGFRMLPAVLVVLVPWLHVMHMGVYFNNKQLHSCCQISTALAYFHGHLSSARIACGTIVPSTLLQI